MILSVENSQAERDAISAGMKTLPYAANGQYTFCFVLNGLN